MPTPKPQRRFDLLRTTGRDLRQNWRILVSVVAIVAVPIAILTTVANGDATVATYASIATLIMNLALIWAVVQAKAGKPIRLKQAYFEGTVSFVRFVLMAMVLALQFIPFTIGIIIYVLGTSGATVTVTGPEQLLLGLLAIILALPTVFWLTRYAFSPYALVEDDLEPIAALRRSKAVTAGNFWLVLRQLFVLMALLIIIVIIPSLITAVTGGVGGTWLVGVLQLLVTLILLPFLNLYLYNLYASLKTD